jgi:hypothetical protein
MVPMDALLELGAEAGLIGRRSLTAFVVGAFVLAGCGSTTTSTTPSTAPTSAPSATPAASGAGSATGSCTYVATATVQQDAGITIATTTQITNGCLFESASGSQTAPDAVKYLHGHDGVILGIATGSFEIPTTCQQTSIPGVPSPGAVCQGMISASATIAYFQLSGGLVGSLSIYTSTMPTLDHVDQLAAAAYPKMLAG